MAPDIATGSVVLTGERDRMDPARFQEGGVSFKAKLIGVEGVPDARGDKMCQDAMQKLKGMVKTAKAHKPKITVNVSLEGLKLIDEISQVRMKSIYR